MAKRYRVIFFGLNVEEEIFRQNMAKLGVSGSILENYIKKAPVVLRRELSLSDARRYADALISAGGLVHIQETGEFSDTKASCEKIIVSSKEDFVICNNCGFKQKKGNYCVRCGFDLNPPL